MSPSGDNKIFVSLFACYNGDMNNCNCIKDCGCEKPKCGCEEPKCGCAKPVIGVEEMPESVATLRFNFNGVSTWYDYSNMIYQTQTDTVLSADAIKRVLNYMAERHVDTISAKELGAILHVADLGDVDITGALDNALFVYQKDSDCGEGCEGINNAWKAWNSTEHQATSLDTVMGFDENGKPYSLQRPVATDEYYLLGWEAGNKLKYIKPVAFGSLTGKKPLYVDPDTGQIGYEA